MAKINEKLNFYFLKETIWVFLLILTVLPVNYFLENNFNPLPLQVFSAGILMTKFYNIKINILPFIFFVFSLLLLISKVNLSDYLTSAISATFIIFSFILLFPKAKLKLDIYGLSIGFLVFIIIFTAYHNFTFNALEASQGRSKGFGSGTISALLAMYGAVYLYMLYQNKLITKWFFYFGLAPLIWALLLTQSRGAIITVAAAFIVIGFKRIKWFQLLSLIVGFGTIFFYTSVGDRFNLSQYDSFNQFTSGRAETQNLLIDRILDTDYSSQLFGFGLNSLKTFLNVRGLEYPHLDLLFVFYEGGIILLLVYLFFLFKIYQLFDNKILFWIFFVSTFHTNMLLSPGFLMLSVLLDASLINKLLITQTLNENNTSLPNRAI